MKKGTGPMKRGEDATTASKIKAAFKKDHQESLRFITSGESLSAL